MTFPSITRGSIPTAATVVIASEFVAIVTAGFQDQVSFLLHSTLFALSAGILLPWMTLATRRFSGPDRVMISVVLGVSFGLLWTILIAWMLGPWMGAFGVPVLVCWVSGGVAGGLIALVIDTSMDPIATFLCGIVILAVTTSTAVAFVKVSSTWTEESTTVEFFRFVPSKQLAGVTIFPSPADLKTLESDRHHLSLVLPSGRLVPKSSGIFGKGTGRRVIIVMSKPIGGAVTLRLPRNDSVIYIQTLSGWTQIPPHIELLSRTIELDEYKEGSSTITNFMVENRNGSKQGGLGIDWSLR